MLPVRHIQKEWIRNLWKRRKCTLHNDLRQRLLDTFHT